MTISGTASNRLRIPATVEQLLAAASLFWAFTANRLFLGAALKERALSEPTTWAFALALMVMLAALHFVMLAPVAQPVQPGAVGQLPVHQPGVEGLAAVGLDRGQRARPVDLVAVGAQAVAKAFAQQFVVLDQQQPHGGGRVSFNRHGTIDAQARHRAPGVPCSGLQRSFSFASGPCGAMPG